ncbi:MAG: hypothetical protein KGN36_08855, partial [Acidobacteriota bacterium]|nr:hypothetical protein [Acidobacteriota bacterium]
DEEFEADLDIQWSGAVAKGAAVKFVVSKSTSTTDGIDLSSQYIANHNLAAVVSLSFGACENDMGSNNSFYNALWQQAAAQGMSVFVSSGDSGSAGCDAAYSGTPAAGGLAVNGLASTAYNVAVGGTQFADTANPAAYWNATSDAHLASARGYIPETVWNESAGSPAASGGGYSVLWRAPSWQSGGSVPAAAWRAVPDVSLAAAGHTGYLVMHGGSLYLVAGTSASAPAFAGLMAVVNQYTGRRNGNPNTRLYPLAAQTPAVFHDVTGGTNAVPCVSGTVNCSGPAGSTSVTGGYSAAAGYDAATGLGSVDAYALAVNWGTASTLPAAPVIASLNPSPMPATSAAQTLTIAGSGFATGATITASYPGYSAKLAVSALSSTRISASIAVGTSARTWTVTVVNPNGQSASAALAVTAPAPAINSLSPNPMTPSASPQTLTLTGSGFATGATVVLSYPGYTQTVSGTQLTVAGPNQIALPITVGTAARSWNVQVVNAAGQVSNIAILTVAAPVSSPVIASLNPGAMSRSSTAQTLTINGSGFATTGAFIVLISPTSAMLLTPKTAAAAQFQVSFVPGTAARTYSVQVVNPGGKISNPVNLVIR